ncbi:hypothetical protein PUV54_09610 [Hyphococcus flavus]|uniref:Secreted protein n=1 Tax=Hyphococcus flavus TaxID=1866326 RepID=A0AAE9ZG40_9PROT|nr:hypothetical protein [Hyphococcus flavus]WDI30216.1 hypothetical protein PUV54_09610 [Hyphococcus flavus]
MCADRKQFLNVTTAIAIAALTICGPAAAQSAGGISIGDGAGGITDRAYVAAPPNYTYVIEKEQGSFLDCGAGQEERVTDEDGRDVAFLRCGVTLTETIVIPAAATSAKITIHY